MNLRDLEYLVALAEERHFRKAAEKCFVSQPTLSGQLRKLEDELGVLLMERTSRKVLFTPAGDAITAQARRVLAATKELRDIARTFTEPMSGELHIGLIPTVGPYLLPHIIPALKQHFPELHIFLYEAQTQVLLKQLADGDLDCLILAQLDGMDNFGSMHLYDEPMLLALPAGHRWADRDEIGLGELKGEKLLMLEDGHCLRDQAMGFCFAAGIGEDSHFKATSLETLRNMVAAGSGLTLIPQLAVNGHPENASVHYLKVTDPQPRRSIALLHRAHSVRRPCFNEMARVISRLLGELL
ncbi:DNA-binding transcriptional regulator OxyR [Oceanimonas baumannii]|uniref:DNA-binding transcriptional regulator OxyR n=1 Tax=Oceanimonas baumannii TaxID=129578 RepID=A0A235CLJ3_9GAMM|nr:DNA-binding transcriptional regulator OxyR [Oceanimonas baumannii]OYD25433.1 DNA-binding transcriptional regulator OxyR [Oceanimonas baumannii]TDW61371.1 LysR family hydrogen peroxide-inducible transcriptional activator [Oceanimonas baumannii]